MSSPTITLSSADFTSENAAALDTTLANSHPLMIEAFYLAAIPAWYNTDMLEALRNKSDGREQGLHMRLQRYSFIAPLRQYGEAAPAYSVRAEERDLLQKRWIAEDPQAYKAAHQHALTFWETHPAPDPFAHEQNCLYHRFFVYYDTSVRDLIILFRTYTSAHQFAATARLITAAEEAGTYLTLLDPARTTGLDDLLTYLKARLAQLRGQWSQSHDLLDSLKASPTPELSPYIARAYGYTLAQAGDYVTAIEKFEQALTLFDQQETAFVDLQGKQNDRAYTLMALGDAYVDLATNVRGDVTQEQLEFGFWQSLGYLFTFIMALPLVLYLSPVLGWRVWHPRFWPVLRDLDWIIARLFVTGAQHYRKVDHILEMHGTPAESVIADEKLAYLYLALGDVRRAEQLFLRLLAEVEAPLSDYHQATVCVGLGETYLRLHQPRYALKPLRTALPVLSMYEDQELEAKTRDLLGRALLDIGEASQAIQYLADAQKWYQSAEKWTEATHLVEHLETWASTKGVTAFVQTKIKALIDNLQKRQYIGIFQHKLPAYFRRLVLMLLPIIIVVAQALTVTVQANNSLAPDIQFRPAPILDPSQDITPGITLGVTTAQITVLNDPSIVWEWAAMLVLSYLFISLLLGIGIIWFTQLRTVQTHSQGATVSFDKHTITVGTRDAPQTIQWAEITKFIKADVSLWSRPTRNNSAFGLETPHNRIVIRGDTNRYPHIREQVSQRIASATKIVNRDCAILRSKMGVLFILNLAVIGIFDLLAYTSSPVLFQDLLGTIYSLADLYPYLFLGLIIAPLWWGIVQPLRQRLNLWPRSRFLEWTLRLGLLLTLFQIIIAFRPLLTVANIYPPFVTIIILASAGIAIWNAQVSEHKVYPLIARLTVAIGVLLICSLMLTVLWRDVSAYHYLVTGHTLRDQTLQDDAVVHTEVKAFLSEKALETYTHAAEIGKRAVWGINTTRAARIPLGIPLPNSFTWLSALNNQAALQVQLGENEKALQSYTAMLSYTDQPDLVYVGRALTLQSMATTPGERGGLDIDRSQYEKAIGDFSKAIRHNPNNATYYLWRGVAQQALGQFDEALSNYNGALELKCDAKNNAICLTPQQRSRALTGQGWIMYKREKYQQALESFWQAKEAAPKSAEVWLAEGYTLYALGLYEAVLPIWKTASELDPQDATILISLGTLHWKFGGKSKELKRDRCEEYEQSIDLFTQATTRGKLHPQLDKDVAYTYRTKAQVLYLLSQCPNYDRVGVLKQSVDSYSEAIRIDPENAFYWQMRGRLSYSVWHRLQEQTGDTDPTIIEDWLLSGLNDLEKALELDPNDDQDKGYEPNNFKEKYYTLPLFEQGLKALQEGDIATALDFYRRVLYPEANTVDTAVKLALIAVANDDLPEAARWFNETVRRVSNDSSQYFSRFKASREHLQALWAIKGVTGEALLTEMEAQLPSHLETYPELRSHGAYWRYRAWLKYYFGLAAFRLEAEADADALLQSCQTDAKRATVISTKHIDVYTYHTEAAWGWYHVERGDGYAEAQNYAAALADYEAGFAFIVPQLNSDAAVEKIQAAFSAGITALKLEQFERAATWYDEGITLVEEYANNEDVQSKCDRAIENLEAHLENHPETTSTMEPILEKLEGLK